LALLSLYACAVVAALSLSNAVESYAIDSLYGVYTEDSATISLAEIEPSKLEQVMAIASTEFDGFKDVKMLNYVLPTDWYAAEIPMNGSANGHVQPASYDNTQYKVIFTAVDCWGAAAGKDILQNVRLRQPILEVWVDLNTQTVTQVLDVPEDYMYQGIPVAVY
jgi:hypothetical protein